MPMVVTTPSLPSFKARALFNAWDAFSAKPTPSSINLLVFTGDLLMGAWPGISLVISAASLWGCLGSGRPWPWSANLFVFAGGLFELFAGGDLEASGGGVRSGPDVTLDGVVCSIAFPSIILLIPFTGSFDTSNRCWYRFNADALVSIDFVSCSATTDAGSSSTLSKPFVIASRSADCLISLKRSTPLIGR